MKKLYFIILLVIIGIIPLSIRAYDIENYYIDAELKSNGDLEVKEYYEMNGYYNGSLFEIYYANPNVKEFDKNISIMGYSNIYDGDEIILHEIRGVPKDKDFNFLNVGGTLFEKSEEVENGNYGYYIVDKEENGERYTIYLPSNKDEAFYVSYTIKNFAVLHNDVGELWWKKFDKDSNTQSISYLRIKIKLPNNKKEFRVWAHGPLNGSIKKVGNDILLAEVTGLGAYTDLSVRTTFDKDIILESTKKSNIDALSKILKYEEDKASEANYEREQKYNSLKNEFISRFEACKENPERECYNYLYETANILENVYPNFKEQYVEEIELIHQKVNLKEETKARELVEYFGNHLTYKNYETAQDAVRFLENEDIKKDLNNKLELYLNNLKKKEKIRDMIGIILATSLGISGIVVFFKAKYKYEKEGVTFNQQYSRDIPSLSPSSVSYLLNEKVSNGAISAEILEMIDNKIIDYEKTDKDYYLSYDENKIKDKLNFKEEALIRLVFDIKDRISLNSLRNADTYAEKKRRYDNWKTYDIRANGEAREEKLIDTKAKKTKTNLIFLVILLINIGLIYLINHYNHFYITTTTICIFSIIMTIIFMMLHSSLIIRTDKGKEEFAKTKAFKNFLQDFGRFNDKELPEVRLWNKYLVYATVLGCATKLLKTMKVKIEELGLENDIKVIPVNIINQLSDITIVRNNPSSMSSNSSGGNHHDFGDWSSGSGSGGGFSSSSSGGGGGGGIGRF